MLQLAIEYIEQRAQGGETREGLHMMDAFDLARYISDAKSITDEYSSDDIARLEKEADNAEFLREVIENVRRYLKDLEDSIDSLDEAIQSDADPLALTPEAAMENVRDTLKEIKDEIREEQMPK